MRIIIYVAISIATAAHGRTFRTTVNYSSSVYHHLGLTLLVTNIGTIPQKVKVNGGMRPMLATVDKTDFATEYLDLGLPPGGYISGWWLRGAAPMGGVTVESRGGAASLCSSPRPDVIYKAENCPLCLPEQAINRVGPVKYKDKVDAVIPRLAHFGGGVGCSISPTDGPIVRLDPGVSIYLQSERYGAGAHGSFEVEIIVTDTKDGDRGAVTASAELYDQPFDYCSCYSEQMSVHAPTINGGRPF